jgi:thiol-disulfide isomerase/thioredoxin
VTRLAALVLPLLAVAGCSAAPGQPVATPAPVPFAACGELTQPPPDAPSAAPVGPAAASPAPAAAAATLPDLQLPCAAGGPAVALRDIRGPAVINLWASWCGPCRSELPAFQRLADRYGGQVHVIGVNTRDRPEAAASLATDLGLTLPTLTDPDERVRTAIRRAALPVTVFVDRSGRVRHIHDSTALDDQTLGALVRRHLDIPVTP